MHYWDGNAWQAVQGAPPPPGSHPGVAPQLPAGYELKKKGHKLRNTGIGCGALIALIVVIVIASQMAGNQGGSGTGSGSTASAPPSTSPSKSAGPTLTGPQQNAVRSAQSYLAISGFSRQGLIDQLSSSAGDQYSVSDATIAVDSLNVDWNAEAVKSAKEYLKTSPFSCQGLIDQLDSSAGSKYTVDQATYGAHQAGAC
ncbi:MAG: Ltp family lipoprotein [Candidatus Dormibacteria bacterium]